MLICIIFAEKDKQDEPRTHRKKDVPRIGDELRRLRRTGGQDPQRTTGGAHGLRQLRGATVEYDTAQCSPEQLKAALQAAGYDLLVGDDRKLLEDRAEQAHDEKYRRLRQRTVWAIILALPVAVIGMFFMHMPYADLISWALSTPVVLWLGRDFHRNAWRQLRHGTANMDTLVSNSTLIAYVFSLFNMLFPEFWTARGVEPHVYFEAASVIIAFILLGRLLEERAKGNTSTAIRKLMGLQPRTVTIVDDRGETHEISIDNLQRGQTVSVRPGERIAVVRTSTKAC